MRKLVVGVAATLVATTALASDSGPPWPFVPDPWAPSVESGWNCDVEISSPPSRFPWDPASTGLMLAEERVTITCNRWRYVSDARSPDAPQLPWNAVDWLQIFAVGD